MKPQTKTNSKSKPKEPSKVISKKVIIFSIALLSLAVFAAFSSSLQNQITNWDDDKYVTDNMSIREINLKNLKTIFTTSVTKTYCPLTILSFAVEYHFFKLIPFHYILDNILIHIAVTVFVFLFGLQLGLSAVPAFLGALLFGIHPMRVESVVWITERKDVLYSFFFMLALLIYGQYLNTEKKKWFVLSVVAGILSILSKGMAFSLPLVLLLCDWFHGRKLSKKVYLEKLWYFAYILPIGFITFQQNIRHPIHNTVEVGITWIWSFTFNFKKFFWPNWLCPIYNVPKPVDFTHSDYALAGIIMGILIYLLIRFYRDRWFMFALLYYLLSIFFLVRTQPEPHVSSVADRFMYLPSVGICLWLGKILGERIFAYSTKPLKKYLFIFAISILMFALSVKTYYQCYIWKDSETLWDAILKYSPCSTAYHNRGVLHMNKGEDDQALFYFVKTLKLMPSHALAHYDIGLIHERRKEYEEAIKRYELTLKHRPGYFKAYHNRSRIYALLKKYDLALQDCLKAISIEPEDTKPYVVCAQVNFYLKKYNEALEFVEKGQKLGYRFKQSYVENIKKKIAEQNKPAEK